MLPYSPAQAVFLSDEAFETLQLLLKFENMILAKKQKTNENQSLRLSLSNW